MFTRILLTISLALVAATAWSAQPAINNELPKIVIESKGEILLAEDTFSYTPWSSEENPGKVHVVQYLAGTMAASKVYREFTDKLQAQFGLEGYHVTTIINLDDAMWGTSGMVESEVKSNKRKYPLSTLVLDKDGDGRVALDLEKKGTALAILDKAGKVIYFTSAPMSEQEIASSLALVQSQIDS